MNSDFNQMEEMVSRPLVSVAVMTYNQERYVRKAVASILDQTYNNIEVIISDDHSTDGTWDVILDEIGKRHLDDQSVVMLNRNTDNMGVAKHFEWIISQCHGEFVVCQAGDDVSYPDRIEKIVAAYCRNKNATVVCHKSNCIDVDGHPTGHINTTSAFQPLGAMMAYSRRVATEFEPISEQGAWEDDVYARRAQMLGEEIRLDSVLMDYRVGGSGISSGKDKTSERRIRVSRGCLASARQSRKDLEFCRKKIGEPKFCEVLAIIDRYERFYSNEYKMYSGSTYWERINAFNELYKGRNIFSYVNGFVELMLPRWVSVLFKPVKWVIRTGLRRQ